jgi:hypothetical protein
MSGSRAEQPEVDYRHESAAARPVPGLADLIAEIQMSYPFLTRDSILAILGLPVSSSVANSDTEHRDDREIL